MSRCSCKCGRSNRRRQSAPSARFHNRRAVTLFPSTLSSLANPNLTQDNVSPDKMTRSIGLKRGFVSAEEDEGQRHQRRKFVACVANLNHYRPSGNWNMLTYQAVVSDVMHIRSNVLVISLVASAVRLDVLRSVPMHLEIVRSKLVRSKLGRLSEALQT